MNEELEKAAQTAELLAQDLKSIWINREDRDSLYFLHLYEDANRIKLQLEDLLQ